MCASSSFATLPIGHYYVSMKSLLRIAKLFLAIVLSFTFTFSLWKLIIFANDKYFTESDAVGNWLDENSLGQYRNLFRDLGEYVCIVQLFKSLIQISIKRSLDTCKNSRRHSCCCRLPNLIYSTESNLRLVLIE